MNDLIYISLESDFFCRNIVELTGARMDVEYSDCLFEIFERSENLLILDELFYSEVFMN